MAELRHIAGEAGAARMHIVFVHGLNGRIDTTWLSGAEGATELWLKWLAHDVPETAIWAVGYEANASSWGGGHALPIPDRAQNVLQRLRAEPDLKGDQEIAFVAHSMGGLVVAEMLRRLDDDRSAGDAREFASRISRIAFLGTPHRGSLLANVLAHAWPLRPTVAVTELRSGSVGLRNLSAWFRRYVHDNEIATLQLAESKPVKVLGLKLPQIVAIDSADASLLETPVPVDETHLTICKPRDRNSAVYVFLRDFLQKSHSARSGSSRQVEEIERVGTELLAVRDENKREHAETRALVAGTFRPPPLADTAVLDTAVQKRVDELRQRRFFQEANAVEEARALSVAIMSGELAHAGTAVRHRALAWCSRLLAAIDAALAESLLTHLDMHETEEVVIARLFIAAKREALDDVLGEVTALNTPAAYGAVVVALQNRDGYTAASDWMARAGM